jgi:small subunit ribosomal protein S17
MADEPEETTPDVPSPEVATPEASTDAPATDAAPVEAAPAPAAAETEAPSAPTPAPVAQAKVAVPPVEDGERPNRRKVREGVVVSDAMQATVVVAVVERVRHPRYGKTVQRTKKLYVHDAEDTAKVGDRVRVQETRPLSKLKRWRLTEVLERAR